MDAENPPLGFIGEAHLQISLSGVDLDVATARGELDRQKSEVKEWVSWINADVDAFNAELTGEVRALLKSRFDKAKADAHLLAGLGVSQRQPSPRQRGDAEARGRRSRADAHQGSVRGPRRGPGRPGWTREHFEERWREANEATLEPITFPALASNFRALDGTLGGISGEQLRRLRRVKFPE
jgi:hypothetical protein